MQAIQIGNRFKNRKGDIIEIIGISKTALILTTKNQNNDIAKYRYLQASGKYLEQRNCFQRKNHYSLELGDLIHN